MNPSALTPTSNPSNNAQQVSIGWSRSRRPASSIAPRSGGVRNPASTSSSSSGRRQYTRQASHRTSSTSSVVKHPAVMSDDEKPKKGGKTYEERLKAVSPISKPLAGKKLTKKLYKLVKKASGAKAVKRGVKEVVKGLKKGDRGLCLIAGDIYPIDVISHLPVLCEEKDTAYIYVPSKHDLGAAAAVKRPTSCVLVSVKKDFGEKELYDKVLEETKEAHA